MANKTAAAAIRHMLEDLTGEQLERLRAEILDHREEPRIARNRLEGKNFLVVADELITTFTEDGAVEVALQALKVIGCNKQREKLAKDTNRPPVASVSSRPPVTSVSRYGDIMNLETTGASMQTAQQDKLKYSGVKASYDMAETDLIEMNNFKSKIENVAQKKGIDPALIAALISRSCRAGRTLTAGKGCYDARTQKYNTYGLMQIDVNPNGGGHTPKGSWDSEEHLCQAIDILLYFIIRIKHKFPEWSKEQQLKGGIAAYNAGDGNIHSYDGVDSKTSGGDYSNDVVARAQWYKSEGGF